MSSTLTLNIARPADDKLVLNRPGHSFRQPEKGVRSTPQIIGNGPAMQKVYRLMSLVARSSSTVLLLGETGTGKGVIADAIHRASPRSTRQMVNVNCAAVPSNLIESELFGHERGSFTGAIDRRIGKFEQANNSTLFLDEVGEMSLEMQVKSLSALQDREIERVGGRSPIKVDVRIVAATNRNLEEEVQAARFRSDLYYRLNVFPIHLPPLRERKEDIVPLANFFLSRYAQFIGRNSMSLSPGVIRDLENYGWPGNVRELEHVIERSVLLSTDGEIREVHLSSISTTLAKKKADNVPVTLHEIERKHIITMLKKCKGRIAGEGGAAKLLKLPPTTLHSKIRKLGISKADYLG